MSVFLKLSLLFIIQVLFGESLFANESPKLLSCIRQLSYLAEQKWALREFHLEEKLYDALPNPEDDGIEIQMGPRMSLASTAVVSFNPDTPPARAVEYLDAEDTNEFLLTFVLSSDKRWSAVFSPSALKIAVYDFSDPENIDSEGQAHPWKPHHIFDVEDYLQPEIRHFLRPTDFAPRLQFSDSFGLPASETPRLLLSTPFRYMDFDLTKGSLDRAQHRLTPNISAAVYVDDSVVVSDSSGFLYHSAQGMGRLDVFGIDARLLGPLHSYQVPNKTSVILSVVAGGTNGSKNPSLALLRRSQDGPPYSLEFVGLLPTEHRFPIVWMKTTRQGVLTYSAEDRVLRWMNLVP